jgi:hypothetical protein
MIIKERIPNFIDFNINPMKWNNIDDFLEDKFLSNWFSVMKNVTDIGFIKVSLGDPGAFDLVLFTKRSRRHIAFVHLQEGDDKDSIIEKIKSKHSEKLWK